MKPSMFIHTYWLEGTACLKSIQSKCTMQPLYCAFDAVGECIAISSVTRITMSTPTYCSLTKAMPWSDGHDSLSHVPPVFACMCLHCLCLHPFLYPRPLPSHTHTPHLPAPTRLFQHVTLRRANSKPARRQLDFTSREGEVDRATVSVCVCEWLSNFSSWCAQLIVSRLMDVRCNRIFTIELLCVCLMCVCVWCDSVAVESTFQRIYRVFTLFSLIIIASFPTAVSNDNHRCCALMKPSLASTLLCTKTDQNTCD